MALQQQHEAMDAEEPPNPEHGRRGGGVPPQGGEAGALADISLIELNDKTNDGQRGKGEGEPEGQGDVVDKDKQCSNARKEKPGGNEIWLGHMA